MTASADVRVGGGTHVAGIIGWPVAHSLSPAIHNAAFAEAGLDWVYVSLPVPPRTCERRSRVSRHSGSVVSTSRCRTRPRPRR